VLALLAQFAITSENHDKKDNNIVWENNEKVQVGKFIGYK
jgi:hypothetical protein